MIRGLTRSSRTPLSTHWAWESNQVLSPDGSTVYYNSDRAELPDIYRQRLDGTGNEELVVSGPREQFTNDISPDGAHLLYASVNGETGMDLMAKPLTGQGEPFAVARSSGNDRQGRFSPDGQWVAYQSNLSGQALIYVKRFRGEGLPQEVSSSTSSEPRWSADGKYVYFMTGEGHTIMRPPRRIVRRAGTPLHASGEDQDLRAPSRRPAHPGAAYGGGGHHASDPDHHGVGAAKKVDNRTYQYARLG